MEGCFWNGCLKWEGSYKEINLCVFHEDKLKDLVSQAGLLTSKAARKIPWGKVDSICKAPFGGVGDTG